MIFGRGVNLPNKSSAGCFGLVLVLLPKFEVTFYPLLQSTTILSPMPPICLILLDDAGIISDRTNLDVSGETCH